MEEGKGKKGLIIKTWERCRSLGRSKKGSPFGNSIQTKSKPWSGIPLRKSKSWSVTPFDHLSSSKSSKNRVAPGGCFTVYVGEERQRFVIKTGYANHPLFKNLLEEAEMEYGFNSEGPLVLPCKVGYFYRVLSEMEMDGKNEDDDIYQTGCHFAKGFGSYSLLSPSRMVAMN